MSTIHAIILGVIEGFTEFLPISSTGHMVLMSHLMNVPQSATLLTFEVVVQLGAIAAVIVFYVKKLLELENIKKLIVAFVPTGIIGLLVFPYIKAWLQNPLLVAVNLTIGGGIILGMESWYKKKLLHKQVIETKIITYKDALLLGLCQAIAVVPGVSRSGAMIIGGLAMKLPRNVLTEFTFLLAVPTMLLASLYTLYKKHEELTFSDLTPIALGTLVAFVVALFVIRFALSYIRTHSFAVFGWYRIILGFILVCILL